MNESNAVQEFHVGLSDEISPLIQELKIYLGGNPGIAKAFGERFSDTRKLISVEHDLTTAGGTDGGTLRLQPSPEFVEFMSALRAGQRDFDGAKVEGHSLS